MTLSIFEHFFWNVLYFTMYVKAQTARCTLIRSKAGVKGSPEDLPSPLRKEIPSNLSRTGDLKKEIILNTSDGQQVILSNSEHFLKPHNFEIQRQHL